MNSAKENEKASHLDVPDFWCPLPPGTALVLLGILCLMISSGISTGLLSGLGSEAYLELSPDKVVMFCIPLITILISVPHAMLAFGHNRQAIKAVRIIALACAVFPIPHLLIGPNNWVALLPISLAFATFFLTYLETYQVFSLYYEKLYAWKREHNRKRKDIQQQIKRKKARVR